MTTVLRPTILRVEDCARVEIADVAREGDHYRRDWKDHREGWTVAISASLDDTLTESRFEYVLTEEDGKPEGICFKADIDFTEQHFGGSRQWWLCPNNKCQRRCRTLYAWRRIMPVCRQCLRLRYRSQDMRPWQRIQHRADAITRQMGVGPYALDDWPPKPWGMHWSTYEKLMDEWAELQIRERETLYADVARFASRLQSKVRPI